VFVASVIQAKKRMRRITLSSVSSPNYNNSPHYITKVIKHKMRVLIFSTHLSETFLILRRTERDVIKMRNGLRVR
jgi:hypothetical protein